MTKQEEQLMSMLYAKIGKKQVELESLYTALSQRQAECESLKSKLMEQTNDRTKSDAS